MAESPTVLCIDASETSLQLSWEDTPGAVHYELQWRRRGADEDFQPLGSGFSSGLPPKRKRNLPSGTAFEFRSRARDAVDWFPWSTPAVLSTLPETAKRMPPPRLHSSDASGIAVAWEPADHAVAYELQLLNTKHVRWTTISDRLTSTIVRKRNLEPGGKYLFRVRPVAFDEEEEEEEEAAAGTGEVRSGWAFSEPSDEFAVPAVASFFSQLFGAASSLTDGKGGSHPLSRLQGSVVAIYFSANWCPPCRQFTPMLAQFYEQAKAAGRKFEVIFISADRDAGSMKEYLQSMPWLAVRFEDPARQRIQAMFQVNGIPNLKIFSPNGKLLDDNAVQSGSLSLENLGRWGAR
mmetsp:Transcript_32294/g.93626  ORF Transcript_32294/g.93626 Transcript_32294/m.93626 type:complete len:349 (-) Transcript_32294:163-1209(-)|eukprot:CAMPEP_0118963210 /NCGR_PEP_ID=MMETSP1173-20130426/1217_1 /TAXON_ID=1034831 /ORGANISM="Rhizochromulina marina cf, Strain CCMP1243" /LENGTH=348 /DNA_ID=CAMNT_0006911529 /DNA_START=40 /DNA_END=1086 /DNA_ORIENTATION=+